MKNHNFTSTIMNTHSSKDDLSLRLLGRSNAEKKSLYSFGTPNFMKRIGLPDKDNNLFMIDIADIIYMESCGNTTNVSVYGFERRFTVFDSLKSFQLRLEQFNFFRTHRSYLINLNWVTKYNYRKDKGRKIRLNESKIIPVSDDNKKRLKQKLQLL